MEKIKCRIDENSDCTNCGLVKRCVNHLKFQGVWDLSEGLFDEELEREEEEENG